VAAAGLALLMPLLVFVFLVTAVWETRAGMIPQQINECLQKALDP
jgi:hypothetical protein